MRKYKINYTLVIVEKVDIDTYKYLCKNSGLTKSELGCTLSHLWCLTNMLKNNYKNCLIFEDDIILHKRFVEYFNHIYENNKDMDFLLLGAHDFNFSKINYKNVKNNIYKPEKNAKNLFGAHANFYSHSGAKRMLNIRTTKVSYFDKEYLLMFNHFNNSGVIYPNMVVQNVTCSSLNHAREIMSENENEYYTKCFINFNFNNYNLIYFNLLQNLDFSDDNISYDDFTEKYLYNLFHDFDKIEVIKKRMALDFFTKDDLKNIVTEYH
jgi:GR25 family glycosyltransferase involved in LPS biosynthesis